MAPEWSKARLSSLADLSGGYAFKSKDYAPSGRFVLRTLNIGDDGSINRGDAVYLPEKLCPAYSRFELQPDDTLFVMVGATLGKVGFVRHRDLPALLNQNMWLIRAKPTAADPRFIHYAFREAIKENVGWASGSARDFVRRDDYRNLEISAPPINEQHAIARVLGALDDKIELNRLMNETLEAMARTLFKSWFVDFDPVRANAEGRYTDLPMQIAELFSSSFEDTPIGDAPKGWTVYGLDEIAHFLNGLALQKYPPGGEQFLPVIKIAQLRSGSANGADHCSADIPPKYIVRDGDILFSWSGSLECVLWAGGAGALNQHLFKVTSEKFPRWLYYLGIQHHLTTFRHIAAGKATTMGHIQRHHLSEAKLAIPPSQLLDRMDVIFEPMIENIWSRSVECRTLSIIRDALLPKLISGEIRVKNMNSMELTAA